ncbi:MAG: CPBP family intramembrane glutamic endopeptidase [Anaerolineae bacterium]|nr:CPBP family intramembrane metalloprotease [Anaerolineae bacterium]MDW7992431.1 CPBP family intramembrane glutamic endopeptidase [Anaerolineae bacterium]
MTLMTWEEQQIQTAIAALRRGQRGLSRKLLEGILRVSPNSEQAWFWLSQVVEKAEEKRFCLEQVLSLNRRNALARRELAVLGPGPSRSPLKEEAYLQRGDKFFLSLTAGYVVLLAAAEILVAQMQPYVGLILHSLLLIGVMAYGARCWSGPAYRFWVGMSLPPLIRLVSFSLPLSLVPLMYWYLLVSVPLFGAVFVTQRFLLRVSWDRVGLHSKGLLPQIGVSLLGVPLGMLEYWILRPAPLVSGQREEEFLIAALILLVSTGFLEELIFRGILQHVATEMMGRWGIVYISLVFAVLHIGYRSVGDFFFVLGVALVFGWYVHRTRSIVGVSLAHGLINIWLFLIAPFLI